MCGYNMQYKSMLHPPPGPQCSCMFYSSFQGTSQGGPIAVPTEMQGLCAQRLVNCSHMPQSPHCSASAARALFPGPQGALCSLVAVVGGLQCSLLAQQLAGGAQSGRKTCASGDKVALSAPSTTEGPAHVRNRPIQWFRLCKPFGVLLSLCIRQVFCMGPL